MLKSSFFSAILVFSVLPQVKNQHLTVLNKPPGVVHVDAAAAWRDEEAVERHLARHARHADSVAIVLLVPSRTSNSFPFGFLWFLAVSLAVFFVVVFAILVLSTTHLSAISCDVLHVLALSHVHVSSPIETTGGQTPAAPESDLLEDLLGSAMSRHCLGTCVSRNLWRVHGSTTNHIQAFS